MCSTDYRTIQPGLIEIVCVVHERMNQAGASRRLPETRPEFRGKIFPKKSCLGEIF